MECFVGSCLWMGGDADRQRWPWNPNTYMLSNSTHMPSNSSSPTPHDWPITGTLDLHLFQPKGVGDLLPEYLAECRKRDILRVRIIHGKGTGQLRERVHAVLERLPGVAAFSLAPEGMGGGGRWTSIYMDFPSLAGYLRKSWKYGG